ncbi:hypothetical protein B0H15DRAFT_829008 [Mycena belliarum]|uniref:Uncharacterized protein n=1 Tax=Mycena belliarum TaxID=1033014 RepID=A0AAD6UFM7_9AGAR|nr:hypothetical protein B0H15DRAFT_829008 [Mycena belliae]
MSYYPAQSSYVQPHVYSEGHRSRGYHHSAPSAAYYEQPTSYGGQNVVYVPGHSSSHRSRHHHHGPTVVSGTVVQSGSGRHHHSHGRSHHSHRRPTLGERIRRFFGFGRKHYRHKSSDSSWGFLGRSRRRKYVDARSGAEVDRNGRQIYRV